MPHQQQHFQTHDGLQLHETSWLPQGPASAAVLLVHGFIEHSGRYAQLAEALNRNGYAVYATDLRGHGKSAGAPVFVRSFDEYLDDLGLFYDRVRARQPDKPLFLLGHSMGGAIVVLFALDRQPDVRGLIVSAAAVQVGGRVFPLLRRMAALASRLFPRLRVVQMGANLLSRDPEVVADFKKDPLVFHGRFPVRTGAEILRAGREIQQRMEAIEAPLLILHGTGDLTADARGSRQLYARASSPDKTLKLYDKAYHDLFHEPEKEQVMADVLQWLDARK